MPRGDGTGPMGAGPKSGRGVGLCSGAAIPGAMNNFAGLGIGNCRRGGRLMRGVGIAGNMGPRNLSASIFDGNEKEVLTNQISVLEKQLAQTKQRLANISPESE